MEESLSTIDLKSERGHLDTCITYVICSYMQLFQVSLSSHLSYVCEVAFFH